MHQAKGLFISLCIIGFVFLVWFTPFFGSNDSIHIDSEALELPTRTVLELRKQQMMASSDGIIQMGPLDQLDQYDQQKPEPSQDVIPEDPIEPIEPPPVETPTSLPKLKDTVLEVMARQTETGYRLEMSSEFNPFIQQTLGHEESGQVIHIVRRMGWDSDSEFYRQDVIVLDPETGEVVVHPLTRAYITDSYTVDSLAYHAKVVGNDLITVSAKGDEPEDEACFQIVKLDLRHGMREILFDKQPVNVEPDFYGAHWFTSDGKKLAINSYSGGHLWIYDLPHQTHVQLETLFMNTWPIRSIHASPDGERFWYSSSDRLENELYDLNGKRLIATPMADGYSGYPPVRWSPDSEYAYYSYTNSQQPDVIIEDLHNALVIAPQAIKIWNKDGVYLHTLSVTEEERRHLEIVGWLTDQVLVMEYELDREADGRIGKVKKQYHLFDLTSGDRMDLAIERAIGNLQDPVVLAHAELAAVHLLELETQRIWTNDEPVTSLNPVGDEYYWMENGKRHPGTVIWRYRPMKDPVLQSVAFDGWYDPMIAGNWLIYHENNADRSLVLHYEDLAGLFERRPIH